MRAPVRGSGDAGFASIRRRSAGGLDRPLRSDAS